VGSETAGRPLLLDTHVWIWYLDGAEDRFSPQVQELLRATAASAGLLVSDISVWEVGTKAARGKLRLMPSPASWIERAGRQPGLSFVPLDRQILLGSTQLPGELHGDSADRVLVSTAALSGVPLVTADEAILDYAERVGGFAVIDARR